MPSWLRLTIGVVLHAIATLVIGDTWGVVVWLLMGMIVGPALDPALRQAHPAHYFVAHVVYGVVSAWVLGNVSRPCSRSAP